MYERGSALDLFAGIGGMTLAAESAGLSVACAIGDSAVESVIYRNNFGDKPYVIIGREEKKDYAVWQDEIPNADYILGRLPVMLRRSVYDRYDSKFSRVTIAFELIRMKNPKGFMFVLSGYTQEIARMLMAEFTECGYNVHFELIDSRVATGMPVYDRKAYIVGIKSEFADRFAFPQREADYIYDVREFMQEEAIGEEGYADWTKILLGSGADIYNYNRKKGMAGCAAYMPDQYIRYDMRTPPLLEQYGKVRRITVRELARTKFFPDEFSFNPAGRWTAYRAICTSVNVYAASQVIEQLCGAVEEPAGSMAYGGQQREHPHRKNGTEEKEKEEEKKEEEKKEKAETKPKAERESAEAVSCEKSIETAEKQKMFLSYCQRDADIADLIEERLMRLIGRKYHISRDIRDVKYRDSFKKFMDSIMEHAYVLMIISDRYLKSVNCMYEMSEVFRDRNYKEKLLFFVLSEEDKKYYKVNGDEQIAADIYSVDGVARYTEYWQDKAKYVDEKIKQIGEPVHALTLINERKRILKIEDGLTEFFQYISDARGLTLEQHLTGDFRELLESIGESHTGSNSEKISAT